MFSFKANFPSCKLKIALVLFGPGDSRVGRGYRGKRHVAGHAASVCEHFRTVKLSRFRSDQWLDG